MRIAHAVGTTSNERRLRVMVEKVGQKIQKRDAFAEGT